MKNIERVRRNTSDERNAIIDKEINKNIEYYSYHDDEIGPRLVELEKEWDIERVLELNASLLGFTGTLLGIFINKKWLILPAVVTAFLSQHAIQGWCPPVPLFRALGYRTRQEIDREKYALKALSGNFDYVTETATKV